LPSSIEISTEGTRVLGGPVGCTAFCQDFAKGVVAEVTEGFKVISWMISLQAQHCLTTGAVQHRISHLLRMISGSEVADYGGIMEAYDNALLDLPKRVVRRLSLPDHAAALVSPPLSSGGLGYRPRKSRADCAFLASYMHTAHRFPKLLPALAHRVPPILDLVPATGTPPPPPSPQAALAARAFFRVAASAPLVRGRLAGGAAVLRHAQNALSAIVTEAETQRVVSLISQACRATWSSTTPTAATPLPSPWSPPTLQQRSQAKSLRPA